LVFAVPECGFAPGWDPSRFGWSQRSVDGAVVVQLAGELDISTAVELRRRLLQVARMDGTSSIVLDLSDVRFIDAHTVGLIFHARKTAAAHGRTLQVDGLRALPARMFSLLSWEPIMKHPDACADEPGGDPLKERGRRADLWEDRADERERLADERERLADEREMLADERDRLADRHDQLLDRRETDQLEHSASTTGGEEAETLARQAALRRTQARAEAAVRRAESNLRQAREAVARVRARTARHAAGQDRMAAAQRAEETADYEERAWLMDRRDFVAVERDREADERDRIAEQRDDAAGQRERVADEREHESLAREQRIDHQLPTGSRASLVRSPGQEHLQHKALRAEGEQQRKRAAADRWAMARHHTRDAAEWGPQAYGPMLLASFGQLARQLLGSQDLTEALSQMLRFSVEAVAGCDWASVTLCRHGRVVDTFSSDAVAAELDGIQFGTGVGPGPEAMQREEPVYVPRLADSARWPALAAAGAQLGASSVLCNGMFVHQPAQWSPLGVFNLYGAVPDAFGNEDMEFCSILAAYLSVAVAMAHRRDEVDRREAALHRGLSTRDVIGQAKGILMERQRLSAGDAFDVLRRASQRLNRKLADVAQQLAETGELPEP
jgi:anti-anti-sigma factor